MKTRILLLSVLVACTFAAKAQNSQVMREGLTFGNSMAPTSKGQIVNPSATSSSAWLASTVPSSVPSGLGTFSKPLDGTTTFTQARSMGLSGLGNSAMDRCANYVPTGNPEADQECAAVNFLSQRCMTASGAQGQILQNNGGLNGAMVGSSYCEGSFGKSANKFDFANQVKGSDTVFDVIKGAQTNAGTMTGQTCQPKTVVTRPAQYEENTCFKSVETESVTCSQVLKVTTTQEPGCTPGQFLTRVVADPCPSCVDKIVYDFTCTATGYRMHAFTMLKSNGSTYTELGVRDIEGRVGFSIGRTLGPNRHDNSYCYSTYYSQSCTTTTCSITTEFYNECQGTKYYGSNMFDVPMVTKWLTSWDNQCRALEQSAGISLGTP